MQLSENTYFINVDFSFFNKHLTTNVDSDVDRDVDSDVDRDVDSLKFSS